MCGLVGGTSLPPSPGVGCCGRNPPSSFLLWCGVFPPCGVGSCGVGFGGVEFVLGSLGGLVVVVKLLYSASNHILWEKILF